MNIHDINLLYYMPIHDINLLIVGYMNIHAEIMDKYVNYYMTEKY